MNRQGNKGKDKTNTERGNHGTRNSWVREAETQGQQVNTIRHTRETNDRKEKHREKDQTRNKEENMKQGEKNSKTKPITRHTKLKP